MEQLAFDLLIRVLILFGGAGLGALAYHFKKSNESVARIATLERGQEELRQMQAEARAARAREIAQMRDTFMHRGEAIARFRVLEDMQRALNRIEGRVDKLVERD